MKDPACEVNEKGTNEKNDGNEVKEEGTSPPLDVDPNEVIEADEETLPYAEKDWQDPEQMEVPETWNQIFRLRYRLDRMTGMTRLREFLVEREMKELSLPVYDPNRGRLHPRELYVLIHVILSDTYKQGFLHEKYYSSIG